MTKEKPQETKAKIQKFYSGTGRRKTSVARIWLYDKKGEITVNGLDIKDYFLDREEVLEWVKPFHAVGVSHPQSKFSAVVKVNGGGKTGQVEAVRHGFARALLNFSPESRVSLKSLGLLTRDSRKKERKKPFLRKARKSPQYSKR